jgi:hypothetical protein
MNKKLIFGLALAVVLVSGSFFGARADTGCACKDMTKNTITGQQTLAKRQVQYSHDIWSHDIFSEGVLPNGLMEGLGNF